MKLYQTCGQEVRVFNPELWSSLNCERVWKFVVYKGEDSELHVALGHLGRPHYHMGNDILDVCDEVGLTVSHYGAGFLVIDEVEPVLTVVKVIAEKPKAAPSRYATTRSGRTSWKASIRSCTVVVTPSPTKETVTGALPSTETSTV